jgi:hypothetical protein
MTIQTLLNSIKHGIENGWRGEVAVRISEINDSLEIIVSTMVLAEAWVHDTMGLWIENNKCYI